MPLRLPALACAAVLALPLPALSAPVVYVGTLSGAAERPTPVPSPGRGSVRITVDVEARTLRVEASFADLVGTAAAAHIHCCTAAPGEGNAGVASMTPTFAGFPSGVTSGRYDRSFDMRDAASFNPAFVTANGGSADGAFAALVAGLNAGGAYFNLHSSAYGGGELRANLAPVPEPGKATMWFIGIGLLASLTGRRVAAAAG